MQRVVALRRCCARHVSARNAASPTRWHELFRQHHCHLALPARCFSVLLPRPAADCEDEQEHRPPPPSPPPPHLCEAPAARPPVLRHYNVRAADFPPAELLRTIDTLPALPPVPPQLPDAPPSPFVYQTLPPLPLCPLHPSSLHKPAVTVAVSGGVDSSVALFLLQQAGFAVTAVYIRSWDERDELGHCSGEQDRRDAEAVCTQLKVELQEVDLVREYWTEVFQPMLDGYARGLTPNPDALCNREIKFGRLLQLVRQKTGTDGVMATGHYARTQRVYGREGEDAAQHGQSSAEPPYVGTGMRETLDATLSYLDSLRPNASLRSLSSLFSPAEPSAPPSDSSVSSLSPLSSRPLLTTRLLTSLDARKDQTYFLSLIPPSSLPHLIFPLGTLSKTMTRRIACHASLPTRHKPDSMGICMIGRRRFPSFISQYLQLTAGHFVTPPPHSQRIAAHSGSQCFTIGQSAAIAGQKGRYYVAGKDAHSGDITVVDSRLHPLLLTDSLTVGRVNWLSGSAPAADIAQQLYCRLRNTEPLRRCSIRPLSPSQSQVRFTDAPHHLVSPGQIIAFYHSEYCLGGAEIAAAGESFAASGQSLSLLP